MIVHTAGTNNLKVHSISDGYKSVNTAVNIQSDAQNFRKKPTEILGFTKLLLLRSSNRHIGHTKRTGNINTITVYQIHSTLKMSLFFWLQFTI